MSLMCKVWIKDLTLPKLRNKHYCYHKTLKSFRHETF